MNIDRLKQEIESESYNVTTESGEQLIVIEKEKILELVDSLVKESDSLPCVSEMFEVGIEVKITKRKHGHKFKIGEVVQIVEKEIVEDDVVLWWCSNGNDKWCIEYDEAEIYYR